MHDFQSDNHPAGENCAGASSGGIPECKCKKPGRLLIMDDEEPILELTARLLASRGYEVETALDGGAAVTAYQAAFNAGNRFDAVIMDLTVPEKMGGYEAFEAMRAIDPKVKAILSSGYSHEPVILNYKDFGIAGIAPKPYRVVELFTAVEKVLGPVTSA